MKEDKVIPKKLYDYNAGCYCGVYMTEPVMKKLVKLHSKFQDEVKKVLNENISELYESQWTMATKKNEDGNIEKSVYVTYTTAVDLKRLEDRIALFKPASPVYCPTVYLVEDHKEAREIAEELLREELENKC